MQINYFYDHLFDLLNDSDLLDVRSIETIPGGYRVTVLDGTEFTLQLTKKESYCTLAQLLAE